MQRLPQAAAGCVGLMQCYHHLRYALLAFSIHSNVSLAHAGLQLPTSLHHLMQKQAAAQGPKHGQRQPAQGKRHKVGEDVTDPWEVQANGASAIHALVENPRERLWCLRMQRSKTTVIFSPQCRQSMQISTYFPFCPPKPAGPNQSTNTTCPTPNLQRRLAAGLSGNQVTLRSACVSFSHTSWNTKLHKNCGIHIDASHSRQLLVIKRRKIGVEHHRPFRECGVVCPTLVRVGLKGRITVCDLGHANTRPTIWRATKSPQ